MNFLQGCYFVHKQFCLPRFPSFKHAQWSKMKLQCWVYDMIFLKKVSQHSQALPCVPYIQTTLQQHNVVSTALDYRWKYCLKLFWDQVCLNLALGFSKCPDSWALVHNWEGKMRKTKCVIAYYFLFALIFWNMKLTAWRLHDPFVSERRFAIPKENMLEK